MAIRSTSLAALLLWAYAPLSASSLGDFEKQYDKGDPPVAKVVAQETKKEARKILDSAAKAAASDDDTSWRDTLLLLPIYSFALPIYPFALANSSPHLGFADRPYAPKPDGSPLAYAEGSKAFSARLEATYQRVSDSIGGLGARLRYLSTNRLGAEASWTRYRERYNRVDLNVADVEVMGAIHQEAELVELYGLGVKMLSGVRTLAGPELRLGADYYPIAPLSVEGTIGLSVINGNGLGDFRASAGVELRRVQLRLGYRSLFGPGPHLSGPEASLAYWF